MDMEESSITLVPRAPEIAYTSVRKWGDVCLKQQPLHHLLEYVDRHDIKTDKKGTAAGTRRK